MFAPLGSLFQTAVTAPHRLLDSVPHPYLSAVGLPAFLAVHDIRQHILGAVLALYGSSLFLCRPVDAGPARLFFLGLIKQFLGDDGFMVPLDVILGNTPFVYDFLVSASKHDVV